MMWLIYCETGFMMRLIYCETGFMMRLIYREIRKEPGFV